MQQCIYKKSQLQNQAYQTMIKYYRKNESKVLKHYMCSLLSVLFKEKTILKFLKSKDKSIFVKDFFISTKVGLKKMEHLHQKETFSWDPYFSSVIFLTVQIRILTLLPICTRYLFTSIVSTVIKNIFNGSRSGVRLTIFFRFYLRDVMRKSVKFIIIWTKRLRKVIDILSVTISCSDQKTGYHNLKKKMGTQLSFS